MMWDMISRSEGVFLLSGHPGSGKSQLGLELMIGKFGVYFACFLYFSNRLNSRNLLFSWDFVGHSNFQILHSRGLKRASFAPT